MTPVFSASYSGLFKTFFDVLEDGTLDGKPVLLGATAGTARHSLALEFAMRPLFAYLRADVVPTAVFAASEDFGAGGPDGGAVRPRRAGRPRARGPRARRQRTAGRRPVRRTRRRSRTCSAVTPAERRQAAAGLAQHDLGGDDHVARGTRGVDDGAQLVEGAATQISHRLADARDARPRHRGGGEAVEAGDGEVRGDADAVSERVDEDPECDLVVDADHGPGPVGAGHHVAAGLEPARLVMAAPHRLVVGRETELGAGLLVAREPLGRVRRAGRVAQEREVGVSVVLDQVPGQPAYGVP